MKYKSYPKSFWQEIESTLESVLDKDSNPVAAFDADGTLWDTDLGENFFQYQIDKKLVPLPPDAWSHYLDMKKVNGDPRAAYLWLAQINAGKSLEQVRLWAAEAVRAASPIPIFEEQKKLISLFLSKGVQVYVITASVKWAVEPGASFLGIPAENVIGVETSVRENVITTEAAGVITYRSGKVEALLAKTKGKKPFFASGNTSGDTDLLESATKIRLAVSAASRDDKLYRAEHELLQLAAERSWLSHRFIFDGEN